MRITRVTVDKLFGIFDHNIPLNNNGITIVIGDNGLGKTVILESINALFRHNYQFFNTLEFNKISIYFDNSDVWFLTKENIQNTCSLYISRDSIEKPLKKVTKNCIYQQTPTLSHRKRILRDKELRRRMMFERNNELYYRDDNYLFDNDLEFRKLMEFEPYHEIKNERINTPKWFRDRTEKIQIKLIETQRIITMKEHGSDSYVNNLEKCSEELKKMIGIAARKSAIVTSKLDSTYPNRLIKKLREGTGESFEELNIALAKLNDRRKILSSVGLVVNIRDSDLLQIKESQTELINLLKLYIDDSHKKLDPYEDLSKKIKLFKEIINKRFKHKFLEIQQEKGFVFKSTIENINTGRKEVIPLSKLSSGEQNELILFYKLIFDSNDNDMILIDEPELSLHISWQNKFIKDLKNITSINNLNIIIATHSPDIIDENWDLRVELTGRE